MKSAYLYIRVSTDEQKNTGYSLPEQEDRLLKYCRHNNIEVKGIFKEDHSAKNFNRPEWKRLLATIKKNLSGETTNILFVKWDRYSRNIQYAYEMIGILRRYNTIPMAIDQHVDISVPENAVMLAVYLSIPEAENERRGMNTAAGIRRAKQMGRYPNKAPLGYLNLTGIDGRKYIAPKQPEANIMKWVFTQIAKNSYRIEDLRKMAIKKGLRCSGTNFWRLIRNPVYCGLVKLFTQTEELQLIKGIHEPIISEDLFYVVQNIINPKKKLAGKKTDLMDAFHLKRYLNCPTCGRKLCGSYSQGRAKKYSYYHCTSSCKIRLKADIINSNYSEKLQQLVLSENAVELFTIVLKDINITDQKMAYLSERKLLQQQIERNNSYISKARTLFMDNVLKYDDFSEIKKERQENIGCLNTELDTILIKLKKIDEQANLANRPITTIFQGFPDLDLADKKHLINLLPPTGINFKTGDISLIPNRALSKILVPINV
ncbi:MAG: recombinase family protein [Mucilaginibacter sp.]